MHRRGCAAHLGERYYIKATATVTVTDGKELHYEEFEIEHPIEATEIVRKWAEEHPQKTMKDILLEKFPNAKLDSITQRPLACAFTLGLRPKCTPSGDCFKCWNTEVKNDVCIMGSKTTDLMVGGVND